MHPTRKLSMAAGLYDPNSKHDACGIALVARPPGAYGVAMCFFPVDDARRGELEDVWTRAVADEGQRVLGWRDVPVDLQFCGTTSRECAPRIRQLFIGASDELTDDPDGFERKLYVIRRVVERNG